MKNQNVELEVKRYPKMNEQKIRKLKEDIHSTNVKKACGKDLIKDKTVDCPTQTKKTRRINFSMTNIKYNTIKFMTSKLRNLNGGMNLIKNQDFSIYYVEMKLLKQSAIFHLEEGTLGNKA